MVCEWGMSEKLGPLTFGKKNEEIFLGREIAQHRDFSEETARIIDQEVHSIVENAQKRAEAILKENKDKLELLANALLEHEILDAGEIQKVLNGEEIIKPVVEEKTIEITTPKEEVPDKEESQEEVEKTEDVENSEK